jgi:two-component system, NtrC family, response regulator HydG
MATELPELASYLEGLPEPHILLDLQYRIVATNAAYRREFSPAAPAVGRTCHEVSHQFNVPCDQAGETCPLMRARESGQRERVLHLHHTPQGDAYVNIELVPLRNAAGEQTFFIEKMETLRVARGQPASQGLIGRALAFRQMLEMVARVGPSNTSVLLLGESGTGKELAARAVHEASARISAPFVVVDCASLPEMLFESELFGHERGAFTGAHVKAPGLVAAASGGTLFLDEVGDIPLAMQVKLLRLLENGTYRRVGSTELQHADVRVVAATHRDIHAMVADGRFREDLYYRLSAFPIHLPALRERSEDIPLLATGLLERVAPSRQLTLSRGALRRLGQHNFPGNVRELRNVLERAALLADGAAIEQEHIERALSAATKFPESGKALQQTPQQADASQGSSGQALRDAEHAALRLAARAHRGSRAELARQLGISQRTLYRKLREIEDDL